MSLTKNMLDTGGSYAVWAVAFHPDGIHLLSGSSDGIRRWRVADGQEMGKQMGMDVGAISVSRDCKWVVCGSMNGASVWDEKIQEKVLDADGTNDVDAVDISPDSTRFATGTAEGDSSEANIWNIVTGERLVGPLRHDSYVVGVKFSPDGERVATASEDSIRIFDPHNGDQLITIKTTLKLTWLALTPLAWSNNGQQIFAASGKNKIFAFHSSTGSQLAESLVRNDNDDDDNDKVASIALATNGKFLSTFGANSSTVSFWNTPTLTRISSPIEDSEELRSIALSPDCSCVAIGRNDGKIMVHNLANIIPESYGSFHAPTPEEPDSEIPQDGPQDKQRPTSRAQEEQPTTPTVPESENRGELGDGDLLEAEVPTGAPAPLFDYDEEPSLVSSTHLPDGEVALPGSSQASPHLPDALPMTYPPAPPCAEEHHDTPELSGSIPTAKRWLQMVISMGKKSQGSHQPDRLSRGPVRPANPRSRSNSPARANTTNKGPSRMAAAQRRLRTVAKSIHQEPPKQTPDQQPKTGTKTTEASQSNKDASNSRQGHADPKTAGPVQQVNDASQPSTGIRVMEEAGDARVSIAFKLPGWMCCFGTGTEDGKH